MNTTTPEKITGQVTSFCERILRGAKPVHVPVRSRFASQPNECFYNVRDAVDSEGGNAVYGWTIWIWPGVLIEAEHHAVWEQANGALIDVTPKDDGEKRVLFLRDDRNLFDFEKVRRRDNIRHALSSGSVVRNFIDANAALDAYYTANSVGRQITLHAEEARPLAIRALNAQYALYDAFLKPSDLCTCGSGRQVRRCCQIDRARRPLPRR